MPENNQQQSSPLILLLVIGGIIWAFSNRGSDNTPAPGPAPGPDKPQVLPADVWESMAVFVEKQLAGTLQQHTDHLIAIADQLKQAGTIPDTSRVDQWRQKRIDITDANRQSIANQLRGKP